MTWPREFHPLTDGVPDRDRTVEVFALEPGGADALADWSGGQTFTVNGAPAVLLPGDDPFERRVVGLGDVAVHVAPRTFHAEPGGGLGARYVPADADEPPAAGEPDPDA